MNKKFQMSANKATGTWIDIPSELLRVFVPFGRTRLNAIGLFYFRQHFHKEIEANIRSLTSGLSPCSSWKILGSGRRIFVAPMTGNQPNETTGREE
ncbi:hypothetical protein N9M22_06345 [Litoricolaceae bacterium]|nr:hypothetical protein [Litorivicinaceae bacterium]